MRIALLVFLALAASCGGRRDRTEHVRAAEPPCVPAAAESEEADPFAIEQATEPTGRPCPPARESAIERLGVTPPESPWAEMSVDEKELYMVGKVLPIMQETFALRDLRMQESLACESCHGTDMRERRFEMPPPTSFPVPPIGSPAFARLEQRQPDMVHFMRDTVMPTMGRLVGNDAYTCNHCHPTAQP